MLVHLFDMDRRRRHWWNGHWGRLARRDLVLYEEIHGGWLLEAREGGVEGDSRWFRPPRGRIIRASLSRRTTMKRAAFVFLAVTLGAWPVAADPPPYIRYHSYTRNFDCVPWGTTIVSKIN